MIWRISSPGSEDDAVSPRNRRVIVVEWAGLTEAVRVLREELAVARKAAGGEPAIFPAGTP
jgi:hypothetical protein